MEICNPVLGSLLYKLSTFINKNVNLFHEVNLQVGEAEKNEGRDSGVQLVSDPGSIPAGAKYFFNGFYFYKPQQCVAGHS